MITRCLEPYIYAAPWIALSAERPLEAHVVGTVITHYSAEDQLWGFSSLRFVPGDQEDQRARRGDEREAGGGGPRLDRPGTPPYRPGARIRPQAARGGRRERDGARGSLAHARGTAEIVSALRNNTRPRYLWPARRDSGGRDLLRHAHLRYSFRYTRRRDAGFGVGLHPHRWRPSISHQGRDRGNLRARRAAPRTPGQPLALHDDDAGRGAGIQSTTNLQHRLPALRGRRLRDTSAHQTPEISPRAHLAQAAKEPAEASVEPHLRLPGGPASDISHRRRHLRAGLHRRGVHEPRSRPNIWADPDPRPPRLCGRKHLPPARLPSKRLQRLSGHDPDTERARSLLTPVRLGNDARRAPAPGRPVLRRVRPPTSRRTRLLQRTHIPVGRTPPHLVRPLAGPGRSRTHLIEHR